MTKHTTPSGGAHLRIIPNPSYNTWDVQEYRKGWFFLGWHHVNTSRSLEEAKAVVEYMRDNPHA